MRLKIDLHVHTIYSVDSLITPKEVAYYAKKRGVDGVAVTDHDRLDSALRMSKEKDFLILPGMEITSSDGHILALNIQDPVARGLTAEETVDRIHNAGGITIACHPGAMFKGSLGNHTTSMFDAVEVINSSAIPFRHSVKRGEQIASRLKIARVAGSDAHYGPEIGCAYTLIDAEPDIDDIVNAIKRKQCQPFGKAIPLAVRLKREITVLRRRFGPAGET
ncbi:MAG: CehA/McbA family metallohydrolase [Candidatus Bathyarchaeia archaeon]